MTNPALIFAAQQRRLSHQNEGCETWTDRELTTEFMRQFAGDPDVARVMLEATIKMWVGAHGEKLGRAYWRASVCGILLGKGGSNSPFVQLREGLEAVEEHCAVANAVVVDERIGTLRVLATDFGSPLWPADSRLCAGEVVQVATVDDDNGLLGVFSPCAPLRGGADLARGIGGWWIKERLLLPHQKEIL